MKIMMDPRLGYASILSAFLMKATYAQDAFQTFWGQDQRAWMTRFTTKLTLVPLSERRYWTEWTIDLTQYGFLNCVLCLVCFSLCLYHFFWIFYYFCSLIPQILFHARSTFILVFKTNTLDGKAFKTSNINNCKNHKTFNNNGIIAVGERIVWLS